ncbi:MAG: sugar ABC transporter permease [Chloroflexi bacterium]|nr:sugar ABC transporter permease [Chloroflexota bacterium]
MQVQPQVIVGKNVAMSTARNSFFTRWLDKNKTGFLFVLPALIFYTIFFFVPILNTIYYSFVRWNGAAPTMQWVGLANYAQMFQDTQLWSAFQHNVTWIIAGTLAPIAIALPLALLVTNISRGRLFYQTAFFMPHILSNVVVAVIWGWIYSPQFGLLNAALRNLGLDSWTRGWLGNPQTALFAIVAAAVWHYIGFCLVIFVAGLQDVDVTLIEAAKMDGANELQRFFHVIIPQMRHVLNMVIVYTLIGGFNVFDIVRVMTDGGPAGNTELIGTYAYKMSFRTLNIGYGATISVLIMVLSLGASIVYNLLRDREEVRR